MGHLIKFSKSVDEKVVPNVVPNVSSTVTSPDYSKYEVIDVYPCKDYLAVFIKYEGIENSEGQKVMVFKDIDGTLFKKVQQRECEIDPHFSPFGRYNLQARFAPTYAGWIQAIRYMNEILTRSAVDAAQYA